MPCTRKRTQKLPAKCRRQQAFAPTAQPSDNQRITKGHIPDGKRRPFSLQFVSFRNTKGRKSEIRQRTKSQPSAASANQAYNNTCIKPRHCASQPSTAILSASTARTPHLHYPTMYFYKKNKPAKTKGYIQNRQQQNLSRIQTHIYRATTALTSNRSLYGT